MPVIAFLFYSNPLSKRMMIFSYYILLSLVSSLLSAYLALHKIHNLSLSNVFMLFEFGLLTWFFSFYLNHRWQRIALWSIPSFAILLIMDFFFFESVSSHSTYARPIDSVLLTFISALSLFTIYRRNLSSFANEPLFWIASAVILYFASTAVLYSLSATLLRVSTQTLRLASSSEAIINIIANLLYTGGFLCLRPRSTYFGQHS